MQFGLQKTKITPVPESLSLMGLFCTSSQFDRSHLGAHCTHVPLWCGPQLTPTRPILSAHFSATLQGLYCQVLTRFVDYQTAASYSSIDLHCLQLSPPVIYSKRVLGRDSGTGG